jgi:hypothetical protein
VRTHRNRFHPPSLHGGKLANTIVQVVIGGGIVFAIGVWLGRIGAG